MCRKLLSSTAYELKNTQNGLSHWLKMEKLMLSVPPRDHFFAVLDFQSHMAEASMEFELKTYNCCKVQADCICLEMEVMDICNPYSSRFQFISHICSLLSKISPVCDVCLS